MHRLDRNPSAEYEADYCCLNPSRSTGRSRVTTCARNRDASDSHVSLGVGDAAQRGPLPTELPWPDACPGHQVAQPVGSAAAPTGSPTNSTSDRVPRPGSSSSQLVRGSERQLSGPVVGAAGTSPGRAVRERPCHARGVAVPERRRRRRPSAVPHPPRGLPTEDVLVSRINDLDRLPPTDRAGARRLPRLRRTRGARGHCVPDRPPTADHLSPQGLRPPSRRVRTHRPPWPDRLPALNRGRHWWPPCQGAM
jgi:hypothetical protein